MREPGTRIEDQMMVLVEVRQRGMREYKNKEKRFNIFTGRALRNETLYAS